MSTYSIILPVRNGGEYLKECVQSILAQTNPDFELLVFENNSTDATLAWISSVQDSRIKIFPSDKNLNIEENWSRIVSVPKSQFMTMIGHDDVLDKNYLDIMSKLIQQYPDAGLYQAHFRYVDKDGKEIRKCVPMAEKQTPPEVLHNFLCSKMDIMGTGFMMRSAEYDRIGGIPAYANLLFADMELWTELARKSYLAVSQQECFSYRIHPAATTSTSVAQKAIQAYDRFVQYLLKIKKEDPPLAKVIYNDADYFLNQYCQGITHKVLRTAHSKRETASVSEIIDRFREYGKELKGDNSFEPLSNKKIKLGKTIDENVFLHSLFLLFKKIYSKPVAG
jgi:glycosyltransferase involved in cell wall biosynthesis